MSTSKDFTPPLLSAVSEDCEVVESVGAGGVPDALPSVDGAAPAVFPEVPEEFEVEFEVEFELEFVVAL